MSDAVEEVERAPGTFSRRTALRAGVAAGVGAVAWSGASITSFGGTPAYADVCSKAIRPVNVSGGCRNTTQASGCNPFGYQPETFTPPSGYTITSIGNNICCNLNTAGSFTFPAGQTCTLTFRFFDSKCGTLSENVYGSSVFGPDASSPLPFTFSCPQTIIGFPNWSNAQYRIVAFCFTGSEPPPDSCFGPG